MNNPSKLLNHLNINGKSQCTLNLHIKKFRYFATKVRKELFWFMEKKIQNKPKVNRNKNGLRWRKDVKPQRWHLFIDYKQKQKKNKATIIAYKKKRKKTHKNNKVVAVLHIFGAFFLLLLQLPCRYKQQPWNNVHFLLLLLLLLLCFFFNFFCFFFFFFFFFNDFESRRWEIHRNCPWKWSQQKKEKVSRTASERATVSARRRFLLAFSERFTSVNNSIAVNIWSGN